MTIALPLVAALAAVACGDPSGGTAARPDGPWGRTFLSVAVTEGGQPRPLVGDTRIRLFFADDGRLVANSGCNTMSGPARWGDGRLTVGEGLATTEMGCDPGRHAQDEWLGRFLAAGPEAALDGALLVLRQEATEIRLEDRETADPDRPLVGTRWLVDTLIEGDAASSVPPDAEAVLTFGDDGRFGGSTGCNEMGGRASVSETTITFSEVVQTMMACAGGKGHLESAVKAVLDGEVAYEIEADVLRLTHPGGRGLGLRAG